jgi:hypothetical protein
MSDFWANPHNWRGTPMRHIPPWLLEEALKRLSKRDRELVLHWHDKDREWSRHVEWTAIREHTENRDLRRVVKDQAAHIANLEAQLMPYLRDHPDTPQEAML